MLQAAAKEVMATMTAGVEGTVQERVCNWQEEMNESGSGGACLTRMQ
jgi:hypothetical protein